MYITKKTARANEGGETGDRFVKQNVKYLYSRGYYNILLSPTKGISSTTMIYVLF